MSPRQAKCSRCGRPQTSTRMLGRTQKHDRWHRNPNGPSLRPRSKRERQEGAKFENLAKRKAAFPFASQRVLVRCCSMLFAVTLCFCALLSCLAPNLPLTSPLQYKRFTLHPRHLPHVLRHNPNRNAQPPKTNAPVMSRNSCPANPTPLC